MEIRDNPAAAIGSNIPPVPKNLASAALSSLGITKGYHKAREGTKYLRYEVLFNPKEIMVNGQGESMEPQYDKKNGATTSYQPRPSDVSLTIPLVVDRTLASKISMGVDIPGINTSLSGGVDALINNFKDGSIQKEVEAFIALLQNMYTRRVVFYWGDIVYDGMLNGSSSTYEIFDPNGNPTRATIRLSIRLSSGDFPVVLTDGEREGSWMQYYNKVFSGKEETFASGVKGSQWGGNLLNL